MNIKDEFKKLNYLLGSYKCNYTADYEVNTDEDSTTYMLLDAGDLPIISHKVANSNANNALEMTIFKKKCIKECTKKRK